MSRKGDRQNLAMTALGGLLILGGIALKAFGEASDVLVIALVAIGGVMVRGDSVVDLVKAWRSKNGRPSQSEDVES